MKKAFKNIFSSILPQLVNIISNLILPGLIILQFGSEINGLVSTTKTVVSYISLVGAGIAQAVTQSLYKPVALGDDDSVLGILKSANTMFNRYGVIYLLITLGISLIYPFIIKEDVPYFTVCGLLVVMSLYGASEFFAIGRYRALLYAHQKVYVCSIIQAISLLLSLLLALLMLKLNANIIVVQFSISFVYVLRGMFLAIYVRKVYPQYTQYKLATPINSAMKKRKDAMVHQLAGLAVTGSQAAILTIVLDLKAASIYSVYNIVMSGLKLICSNLCTAITPFLGKRYALEEGDNLKRLYNIFEFSFFLLVTFILSVTAVMLVPFVLIYTKNADIKYFFPTFAMLFVVSSGFYILKLPSTAAINVAGHFKETKWRAITEAILAVSLSVLFAYVFGLNGVLIGTGCALGWRCLDTLIYSSRYIIRISPLRSILRLGMAFANIFFVKIVSAQFSFSPVNYGEWVVMALVISVFVLLLLLIETVVFDRKVLKEMIAYIRKKRG